MKRSNRGAFFFDLLPSPFILVYLFPFTNFLPSLYSHIILSRLDMKANALLSSVTRFKDHNELLEVSTLQTSVHYGTVNNSSFKTSPERRGQGAFHKALTGTGISGLFMAPLCEYYQNYTWHFKEWPKIVITNPFEKSQTWTGPSLLENYWISSV